jgi:hypothetical protein
MDPFLVTFLRE